MGLSLFSVESPLTCKVFVLKYWTQVLLCCVLPVKIPFSDKFCAISPIIFSGIRQSICELQCWWYCHLSYSWCVQKLSKYQVGIKWIMHEKLILRPNNDVSWRVLKSSRSHEFVEILEVLSIEELMRAQLICSIVGHIWHAVWLILLLVVSYLSIFVCSVKHQVSKE